MENNELIQQCTEKAQTWLTPAYDAETQAEVKRMLENPDKSELIDAFYKDLEFGTGGLRGIQQNEYLHGRCRYTGLGQLPEQMLCRKERHLGSGRSRLP